MGAHRDVASPNEPLTPIHPERRKIWRTQNCRRCCRCRRPEPPPMTAADFCVTTDGSVSRFGSSDFSASAIQKRCQRQGRIACPSERSVDGPMDQLGLGMLGCIFAQQVVVLCKDLRQSITCKGQFTVGVETNSDAKCIRGHLAFKAVLAA